MYNNIQIFKGLNAMRFFAAYFVVLHHAEQIRLKYEMFNWKFFSIFNNGGFAVTFFFVLSGFLITYLLMKEIKQRKDVAVKKFYVRRILRIWPLYFLLVFIGTLAMPYLLQVIYSQYDMPYNFHQVILYFLFFTPFMVNIIFGHHLLEPLWSIGVEELFYLIWAPLVKFLKNHILAILLSVIALKILLLTFIQCSESIHPYMVKVVQMLQFEAMAIGGLAAYIIFHYKKDISKTILFSKPVQILFFAVIFLRLMFAGILTENTIIFRFLFNTPIFSNILFIVSFAWLIVNTSLNSHSLLQLNNKVLNFLGEISYGIYMYHMLIIFGTVLFLKNILNSMNGMVSSAIFYVIITIGVIFISYLSKKYFEDRFLRLKEKFN